MSVALSSKWNWCTLRYIFCQDSIYSWTFLMIKFVEHELWRQLPDTWTGLFGLFTRVERKQQQEVTSIRHQQLVQTMQLERERGTAFKLCSSTIQTREQRMSSKKLSATLITKHDKYLRKFYLPLVEFKSCWAALYSLWRNKINPESRSDSGGLMSNVSVLNCPISAYISSSHQSANPIKQLLNSGGERVKTEKVLN